MTGFVNALAILIFMAQLPELIGVPWLTYVMVAAGLAIIYLLPAADQGRSLAAGLHRRADGGLDRLRARRAHRRRHGRAARRRCRCSCCPTCRSTWRRCMIILPYSAARAGGGPAGIADDRLDRRRADRHAERQEPRMRRPGHRQLRHRLHRRHGRLRHDRPVGHQREVGRARAAVDLRRRRVPAVPDRRARRSGAADPDGGAGRGHDHGLDRHLQLDVHQGPADPSAQLQHRHAGDRRRAWSPPTTWPWACWSACCCPASSSPGRWRRSSASPRRCRRTAASGPTWSRARSSSPRPSASSQPSTSGRRWSGSASTSAARISGTSPASAALDTVVLKFRREGAEVEIIGLNEASATHRRQAGHPRQARAPSTRLIGH